MFKVKRREGGRSSETREVGVRFCNSHFNESLFICKNPAYFVHIHTADKRILCKNQMYFYSFVLLCKCKAYDSDNMPVEIS